MGTAIIASAISRIAVRPLLRMTALASLAAVALGASAASGLADDYPTKTIRLIVPHSAGSGVDTAARQMAARLAAKLGQQIVVENQPASNSIIGTDLVAKSEPDGYTLLFNSTQHTINPALFKSLPYDTLKVFTPVARVTSQSLLLAVPASLKVDTLQQFIDYARTHPGLNYASTGTGSSLHLAGAYFDYVAKLKANHIPYKTAAQAISDLVRGDVSFMFYPYPPLKPHIDNGSLKVLAVTGADKPSFYPNASPMKDLGYPDFVLPAWHAFYAPARTPRPIIDKLAANLAEITKDPDTIAKLGMIGVDVYYAGPDELAKLLPQEIERYRKIIDIAGVERQ